MINDNMKQKVIKNIEEKMVGEYYFENRTTSLYYPFYEIAGFYITSKFVLEITFKKWVDKILIDQVMKYDKDLERYKHILDKYKKDYWVYSCKETLQCNNIYTEIKDFVIIRVRN